MTDYTKSTNFAVKDTLPTGDPGKVIKGTEFDAEFNNIQTSNNSKANKANSALTGATTIASATITTADINGGTLDAAIIGATTPAAITGTTVTATTVVVTGLVDGRDVAADGTKLDGVELGATANQTGAQIKTAYEAEANAFTDTKNTKLAGIETAADVTDVTNVTAAGALMDAELTDIAAVKALDQGVATTDSPSFAGLTSTNTVNINSTGNALFEMGGASGAIIDLKTPFSDNYDVRLNYNGSTFDISTIADQPVRIRHQDSVKLSTSSTGVDVLGNISLGDNNRAVFGVGSDLQIYHDGGNSRIAENGTGSLILSSDELRINNSANTSEAMRIDSSGNVLVGTTTSPTGSNQIVAGNGVYLGGTAAANKLNDYEEGTWTPTFRNVVATYTVQDGSYTVIGNLVTCVVNIQISAITLPDGSGVRITLPFGAAITPSAASGSFFAVSGETQMIDPTADLSGFGVDTLGLTFSSLSGDFTYTEMLQGAGAFRVAFSYYGA